MTKTFLDEAYQVQGCEAVRELYDQWADSYDRELHDTGYATPRRVAMALRAELADPDAPVLDFGCGTGLSGEALAGAGFSTIDGVDVSDGMLREARGKGIYRCVDLIGVEDTLADRAARYAAIAAIGVIGAGAAPIDVIERLWAILPSGGRFAVSFNDHTLRDPAFVAKLNACVADGAGQILFREHGDHLPGRGIGATIFVLARL